MPPTPPDPHVPLTCRRRPARCNQNATCNDNSNNGTKGGEHLAQLQYVEFLDFSKHKFSDSFWKKVYQNLQEFIQKIRLSGASVIKYQVKCQWLCGWSTPQS